MAGINKVILVGNLGADPEVRYTQGGLAITNLRIATSENRKDRATGETRELTEWHRVVCFDRLAEIAGEYLRKGAKVYIEGSLRTSKYEKEGQTHYSTEITAREMQMLDRRAQGGGEEGAFEPRQATGGAQRAGSNTGAGMGSGGARSGGMSGGSAGADAGGMGARDGGRDSGGMGGRRDAAPAAPVEDFDDDIPF